MANSFLDLPLPAGDGAGTSVDTSAMGKEKTFVVGGSFIGATLTIEASVDNGVVFKPITTFSGAGKKTLDVASEFLRVFVAGRSAEAFAANADVGGNDTGGVFVDLTVPAVDGVGAPTDISGLGNFTTIIAGGSFEGASLTIELSVDGASYAPQHTFTNTGGIHTKEYIANWARVRVAGREGNTFPFTPSMAMGATNDAASGSVGATGETLVNVIRLGGSLSHASDTPRVAAQTLFNPLQYDLNNTTRTLKFCAVAANGGGVTTTRVQLFNVTDSEVIATLDFTSATPTKKEVVLAEGAGVGEVDLSDKIYETRILVVAPDGIDDSIEFGSAEIQIINTID